MNNIIERNIDVDKFLDGTTEQIPMSLGYHELQFRYINDDLYENNIELPKRIHFIWIGKCIPTKYVDTVIHCKKLNASYEVILWVDDNSITTDIIIQLQENSIQVKNIYKELELNSTEYKLKINQYLNAFHNYGFKADIIRLYVVYRYGGIYSDIDSVWIKPLDDNFHYEFVNYRIDSVCSNLTNAFFGFNKDSFIVKNAIDNLTYSIPCFLRSNNHKIIQAHIPCMTGPNYLTRIIKESRPSKLNYIHQGYCVIGGPHEEVYHYFTSQNKAYCYQTCDKNWCV